MYGTFALFASGSVYALLLKKFKKDGWKVIIFILISILISTFLIIFLGWRTLIGVNVVDDRWKDDGYRVDYVYNYGFAGSPSNGSYMLNSYAAIPLFVKKIDSVRNKSIEEGECKVQFTQVGVVFDRCEEKIESGNQSGNDE